MNSTGRSFLVPVMSALLILAPAFSTTVLAQTPEAAPQHVVSTAALKKAVAASVAARRANQAKVQAFLSTPRARHAMKKAGMNYRVVRQAIPLLSQAELASLAARTGKAQKQFRAGSLTNQQLTYIIIALATAIIVIIAVH